jgi:FSR family fosmidomycin resistance protein-like MFS transporter
MIRQCGKGCMDRQDTHADGQLSGEPLSNSQEFQTGHVITVSFAHALSDVYSSFLAPLLPVLIARLSLSNTQAGLLAFMQSSPSLLQPLIGYLADRVSLRYFVILLPALTATAMSLLGLAPRYAVVALLVAIAGLCSAAFHAAAPAMAGRLSGWRLGRGLGFWTVGGYLGFAVGPILVTSVVNLMTLEGTAWLAIGGWLGSAVLYLRLRHVALQPTPSSDSTSWRRGMQRMRPILIPVAGIILSRAMSFSATLTFLPVLLTRQGVNLWFAGFSLSLVQLVSAGGALITGSASDRIGRRSMMFISVVVPPVLILALVTLPGWGKLLPLVGLGLTMPAAHVISMALMQECCPDNRALATGVLLSITFISESLGAVALGALADLFGLETAFTVAALVLFVGLPLVPMLPRETLSPSRP